MIKLTPVLAFAVAVLCTSLSPAAFAQAPKPGTGASSSTASSYSPPVTEHKKKPRKPKMKKGMNDMPASQ
ncbi:hypothetical protein [Caballeronia sordidicola]|jgi:hypothetical protein|uniref:Acid shock protein n=1 Tax=Caballeronia sordidicola TaxID=196367 RepID=A0A242M3N1_CABSO|nr:hypothetical protein [Caballeronia sordidicola]OTP65793.1 hypothetical protein PAMC26510_36795 [Caballeronia sordidicola]